MAAASPRLIRLALLGPLHYPHRQTGLGCNIGLSTTRLDPRRPDGSGERRLLWWATDRTARHGLTLSRVLHRHFC